MKNYQMVGVVAAVAITGLLWSSRAFPDQAADGSRGGACYRRSMAVEPSWISNATWNGNEILVVDPQVRQVLRYDSRGDYVGTLSGFPAGLFPEGEFRPATVTSFGDVLFINLLERGALLVDRKNRLVERRDWNASPRSGAAVGSIYDRIGFGPWLLGYGSVHGAARDLQDPKPFKLGFFAAKVNDLPSEARLLLEFPQNAYYLLGFDYLASNNSGGFFIAMDENPAIYQWNPGRRLRQLRAMPKEYATIRFPATGSSGPNSSKRLYSEIEDLTIPVGLYGSGRWLYLLGREPQPGGTRWTLYTIDSEADRLVGKPFTLPTRANHLSVVPAKDFWYFIEKGPVESWGQQAVRSMLAVPAEWLNPREASPLHGSTITCRNVRRFPN